MSSKWALNDSDWAQKGLNKIKWPWTNWKESKWTQMSLNKPKWAYMRSIVPE